MKETHLIELPNKCYSEQYLKQSGIYVAKGILDTEYNRGLGKVCYVSFVSFIVLTAIAVFLHHLVDSVYLWLKIIDILALFSLFNGIAIVLRHFSLLHIRHKVRQDPAPIQVEPIAFMLLEPKDFTQDQEISTKQKIVYGVVYKELGVTKPKFYLSGSIAGVPKRMPGSIALLYKHRTNEKFFSIDNEYYYSPYAKKQQVISGQTIAD